MFPHLIYPGTETRMGGPGAMLLDLLQEAGGTTMAPGLQNFNFLHRPSILIEILPQEKRLNRDKFNNLI